MAEELDAPVLAQIPIVQSICDGGDNGEPVALNPNTITGQAFAHLAQRVVEETERRNRELAPTQVVEIEVKRAEDVK